MSLMSGFLHMNELWVTVKRQRKRRNNAQLSSAYPRRWLCIEGVNGAELLEVSCALSEPQVM